MSSNCWRPWGERPRTFIWAANARLEESNAISKRDPLVGCTRRRRLWSMRRPKTGEVGMARQASLMPTLIQYRDDAPRKSGIRKITLPRNTIQGVKKQSNEVSSLRQFLRDQMCCFWWLIANVKGLNALLYLPVLGCDPFVLS